MKIPKCCWNCKHLESDWNEFYDIYFEYCTLNIFFPTKKKTCKRQIKDAENKQWDDFLSPK